MESTGYASYDRRIIEGVMTWRYSPFIYDGTAQPVCTSLTFIFSLH